MTRPLRFDQVPRTLVLRAAGLGLAVSLAACLLPLGSSARPLAAAAGLAPAIVALGLVQRIDLAEDKKSLRARWCWRGRPLGEAYTWCPAERVESLRVGLAAGDPSRLRLELGLRDGSYLPLDTLGRPLGWLMGERADRLARALAVPVRVEPGIDLT